MGVILRYGRIGYDVVIWEIRESLKELMDSAHPDDALSADRFGSDERKIGHLAARAALREILPDAVVAYDGDGAPYLVPEAASERTDWKPYISFSHCRGAAAVIVSGEKCAIDIEDTGRDFERTADRYVSAKETGVPGSTSPLFLPAMWCAKEVLYKYGRCQGTDLLKDMEVISFDPLQGKINARLREEPVMELAVRMHNSLMICHAPSKSIQDVRFFTLAL